MRAMNCIRRGGPTLAKPPIGVPKVATGFAAVAVNAVQRVQVQVIGGVVRLGAQDQAGAFGHADRLLQSEVQVVGRRSLSRISRPMTTPLMTGRSELLPSPLLSTPVVMLKGKPEAASIQPESMKPQGRL